MNLGTSVINDLVGFYLRVSYWYEYRATYALLQETKYDKLSLQVQCPGKSDLQLPIFNLFYVDAIN